MPAHIRQRIRRFIAVYLLAAWGVAWSAMVTAGPDLLALPWMQAVVGCGVAWLGGFAATLGRKLSAEYDDKPFRAKQEFARDAAVSIVIGLAGYLGGMANQVSPATLALVLLLGGYAGTRTLGAWVDRVIQPKE